MRVRNTNRDVYPLRARAQLKLAASDLFWSEWVGTIRSVFNEASSDELRDLPALVHLRQNLVDYCQSFTFNQAYLANYPEYYRLFEEFGDEIKAFDPKLAKQLYERAIAFQGYLLATDAITIPAKDGFPNCTSSGANCHRHGGTRRTAGT